MLLYTEHSHKTCSSDTHALTLNFHMGSQKVGILTVVEQSHVAAIHWNHFGWTPKFYERLTCNTVQNKNSTGYYLL